MILFFFYKCRIFLMRGTFLGWLILFFMTASSATFSKVVLRNCSILSIFLYVSTVTASLLGLSRHLSNAFHFSNHNNHNNKHMYKLLPTKIQYNFNTFSIFICVFSFADSYEKIYDWLLNATECLVHELFDRQGPKFAWLITRKNSILLWSHSAKVFSHTHFFCNSMHINTNSFLLTLQIPILMLLLFISS